MTETEIQELLAQVPQIISPDYVYEEALKKLDVTAMVQGRPLTMKEAGWNFAYVGFLYGVEWALRNLEAKAE